MHRRAYKTVGAPQHMRAKPQLKPVTVVGHVWRAGPGLHLLTLQLGPHHFFAVAVRGFKDLLLLCQLFFEFLNLGNQLETRL